MTVPNQFANVTTTIPLSQLDANFNTPITLGNTAIQLGNTVTTLNNMTFANVTITSVSTPITAAQGGTGLSTLASNNVLLGNGTGTVQVVAPGSAGNVLTSTGTTWTSNAASSLAVTSFSAGTTGFTPNSATQGAVTLAGTLATTNGGTGLTSFTANGVLYASSTSALTTGSAFTFDGSSAVISVNSATNALRITQTGAGNALVVEDSANPDSTPFVVDAAGRVLIGATSTTDTPIFQVNSPALAPANFNAWRASTNGAGVSFRHSRSDTVGTQASLIDGDSFGSLNFAGSDGTSFVTGAAIFVNVDGTPGTNDMPGRIVFSTRQSGGSGTTERMRIDSAGNVGIGGNYAGSKLYVSGTYPQASGTLLTVCADGAIPSAATNVEMFRSSPTTQASTTLSIGLKHFIAYQGTFGASTTVQDQSGYVADSSLTGATNNYGFYGNIASGTGRFNFYANGTADNYFAGNVGIGQSPPSNSHLAVRGTHASSSGFAQAVYAAGLVDSSTTTRAEGFLSGIGTADAAFTCPSLSQFYATQGTITGGSRTAVTAQYGFHADSTLTGATNNYGFFSNIASGTGRWNFYANGTANNAFAGNTRFGAATAPTVAVDVTGAILATTTIRSSGATSGIGYATGAGSTATQGAGSGKATAVTLNNVCGQITLNNAALNANTTVSFTLTNSAIAATDVLVLNHVSAGTAGAYTLNAQPAAGSATINVRNVTAGNLSEAIVIGFAVIKAVTA